MNLDSPATVLGRPAQAGPMIVFLAPIRTQKSENVYVSRMVYVAITLFSMDCHSEKLEV